MSLRHAVLGLLADTSASGYDLMKSFETSLDHVWHATQSQVYGELGKLTTAGLLEVSDEGPRGRKEYVVTPAGRDELRRWLTETEPVRQRRNDTLLRVFFLGELSTQEAVGFLEREAERCAGDRAALEEVEKTIGRVEPFSVNGRLALEFGLRLAAMQEEWARWAAAQVGAREEAAGAQDDAASHDASGSPVEPEDPESSER